MESIIHIAYPIPTQQVPRFVAIICSIQSHKIQIKANFVQFIYKHFTDFIIDIIFKCILEIIVLLLDENVDSSKEIDNSGSFVVFKRKDML
jgi:hypothetical protein